jgi:hypothetical protein
LPGIHAPDKRDNLLLKSLPCDPPGTSKIRVPDPYSSRQNNQTGTHMRYIVKILPLAATLAAFAAPAFAKTIDLTGTFATENMAKTTPSGMVSAKLNTTTDELTYSITYAGLSGPVEAAHFHGPAAAGADAGVLVPIPAPYHSGMTGSAKVTPAIAKDLEAGKTYVNLHTAAEPMGEARAQLTVTK